MSTGPLDALGIPDGTTAEEHGLVTGGDAVVSEQNTVELGVRGRNILAGEHVTFGGDIEARADCRLDILDDVADNILIGSDTCLDKHVHTAGRLMISGDLDIGDNINIEEGFEVNDWIITRNPIPTFVFYFIVLSQLLRFGEDKAAGELAETLAGEPLHDPLVISRNATVSGDAWRVPAPARVGSDCRIHGDIRAKPVDLAEDNNVFGGLRAHGDIVIGNGARIHDDVTIRNDGVRIHEDVRVLDDVSYSDLVLEAGVHVDDTIHACGEIRIHHSNLPREAEQPTPRARCQD